MDDYNILEPENLKISKLQNAYKYLVVTGTIGVFWGTATKTERVYLKWIVT